jgi:hypothetical protein
MEQKTIIIAGINGDIGKEFAKFFINKGKLYGLSRGTKKSNLEYEHLQVNLINEKEVSKVFDKINITEEIIYIHLVGKFRFEDKNHPVKDENGDGIDDDIFETNVTTFRRVRPFLQEILDENPKAKIKIVAIGSSADLYEIPYYKSFTCAKNELRKEFRLFFGNPKNYGRVASLFINVTTVDGTQLATERPFISKDYVLMPKDVVAQSLPYILDKKKSFVELVLIKPNPNFENWCQSCENVRKIWYRDMYGDSAIVKLKGENENEFRNNN